MEKKVALVTGASSGIGLELSKLLLDKGYVVYGMSRKGIAAEGVTALAGDVTDPAVCENAVQTVVKGEGRLDLLCNNAGMGIAGAVENTEAAAAKYIFDVNFFGAFYMMRSALPHLRKSGGRVLNVSSVAARVSIPYQAFYSASKAALDSLSSALRGELKAFGVKVVNVLPGDAKTGFTGEREVDYEKEGVYAEACKKAVETMAKDEQNGMQASAVAMLACKAVTKKRPKKEIVLGGQYKILCGLIKVLPKSLVEKIVQAIY